MTNLDSILKIRDITFPTKVHLVKAMVFPVAMYRCESWSIQKAEHQRIDAFELRCWRRLLRVPWTARRLTSQSYRKSSLLFIGKTDAEAETPILWSPDVKNWLIVTACGEWCWICDLRRRFNFKTRDQAWSLESLCIGVLLKWKWTEKASDIDIRRGMESAPLASL